ncbi:MAG: hypothetical protein ACQESP_06640, partial [Candidatus Muiribacteriota bacterium]
MFKRINFLFICFTVFMMSGCMSDQGLVFLKEEAELIKVNGRLVINDELTKTQANISSQSGSIKFNNLYKEFETDSSGRFSVSYNTSELAGFDFKKENISDFIYNGEMFRDFIDDFPYDTEEVNFSKYAPVLSIYDFDDYDTLEIIISPAVLSFENNIELGVVELLATDNQDYFFRGEDFLLNFNNKNFYFNVFNPSKDSEDIEKIKIIKDELIIGDYYLRTHPYITEIITDDEALYINGFNFGRDTASVIINSEEVAPSLWDTNEVRLVYNDTFKEDFSVKIKTETGSSNIYDFENLKDDKKIKIVDSDEKDMISDTS